MALTDNVMVRWADIDESIDYPEHLYRLAGQNTEAGIPDDCETSYVFAIGRKKISMVNNGQPRLASKSAAMRYAAIKSETEGREIRVYAVGQTPEREDYHLGRNTLVYLGEILPGRFGVKLFKRQGTRKKLANLRQCNRQGKPMISLDSLGQLDTESLMFLRNQLERRYRVRSQCGFALDTGATLTAIRQALIERTSPPDRFRWMIQADGSGI